MFYVSYPKLVNIHYQDPEMRFFEKKKNGIRYIIWTQSTMRPHQNLLGIISMDKHGTFHIKGQCIDVFKNDAWNGF